METKPFGVVSREGQAGASGQAISNIFKSFMRFSLLAAVVTWGTGVQAVTNIFTASGNWVAPAGVTSIVVEAWGGGGAGGGATGNPAKGGGGAGGQYAKKVVTVVPGTTYAIVVGAGGTGGTGDGPAGVDSTFAATVVVAKGGAGGTGAVNGIAGTGSSANGVGDQVYAGGSGSNGVVNGSCSNGGAGGGGAGSNGDGGDAFGNTAGTGTAARGGNGGAGRNNSGNGNVGSVAGGGGGGACAETNTNRNGGDGAAGRVEVTYFTTPVVFSIARADPNPTGADSVSWVVVFNTSVTGVSSANFALANAGLTAPAITGVTEASGTGSNSTWTVTASTGTGAGTLGLNMTSTVGVTPAITNLPFTGQVYSVRQPVAATYFHDTTSGVAIGFDGPTNVVSGTNVTIPPIITASLITANTCTGSARSGSLTTTHPTGLYTHSRWYLTQDYIVATDISANPSGSARLRGGSATDTVTVSLYDYDSVSGAKVLIGSSAPITLTNFTATTTYPYTITSSVYTVPAGHRLMLQYDFNQTGLLAATYSARVYCDSTRAYISVIETPASSPHHIQITHDGNALTCSPDVVTITACADAACTILYTAGGVNVTLTPGGQTFTIDATGVNGTATVQQSTAGAATLGATSTPATQNAATCLNTATGTASCAMTFSDSGFVVTVPNHVSCNNATATIEAVQTAPGTGRCIPAYQNVTRAVSLYSSYTSPASGTQAITASTGAVSTTAPGSAHNLAFDATGTATITLSYPDAGQLTLTAGDTAPTGKAMTGSGTFVVAPASFAFSAIPAAPLTAGQAFNTTVTAMNACATPAATPNFNGTVALTSSNPQPGPGNATAINTNLSGFSNGVASANLVWGEVGTIDLNASLTGYLGWTPTAPATWLVNSTRTGVGRFQPAYFDTAVTPGCATFTYAGSTAPAKAGQPFKVTVTANKAGGGVTANYAGANAYLTTLSNAGATTGLAGNTIAAASFANGVGSANVTYAVATPETTPLTLAMRATDADPSPVSSSGHAEGAADIRSGRAKLVNAHGSELLTLHVPFRAEYWSNNGWVLNSADTCSGDVTLGAGNAVSVTLGSPPASCVQDSGNPGLSGAGCAAAGPAAQRFKEGATPGAGFVGDFNLWLSAPGAGNNGVVTVTGNVPAWLQYAWGGAAVANPAARATFGVYKGNNEFIYLREN